MGFADRQQIIRELEDRRQSRIICYLTSTRHNTNFQIGSDAAPRIYEHLCSFPATVPTPKIELFLHSNGGDGVAPWRIVTLIREFTDEFNVLIPHHAFSAATLVSLGASSIFMHPMGVVGPTDPTVANPFNPVDPANPAGRLGISVEDVYAYIALIKEDVGIKGESELVQAFKTLTEQLHPLALGNVRRFYAQSRMMAKKLLALHMNEKTEHALIHEIADNLTSKLYFHGHPINRTEAKDLGLKVKNFDSQDEATVWKLYSDFSTEMKMLDEFNFMHEWTRSNAGKGILSSGKAGAALVDIDPLETWAPRFTTIAEMQQRLNVVKRGRDRAKKNSQATGQITAVLRRSTTSPAVRAFRGTGRMAPYSASRIDPAEVVRES